jgi:c-di-GMP-related signal transduction protein
MIDNWLLYGFKDASTRTLTFLNCTRDALLSGLLTLLPKWAVLEVLETVQPDREVVKVCRRLKKLGYLISLDDFESTEKMEEMVELAGFIKIDFRNTTIYERRRLLRKLHGSKARLIAEKVETEAEFLMAKWEGFQLF